MIKKEYTMTLEILEKDLREIFIKKYEIKELIDKNNFFIIRTKGLYKQKEISFKDLISKDRPEIVIKAETYTECFTSLLKTFREV